MNWSRIKTIMICFLVFINVFLISFLGITTYKKNNISSEVVNASIKVLSDKNFSCDKNLFPNKNLELPRLNAYFYSPSELCDVFFKRQVPFRTVGNLLIAEYNGATLEVKDNYFCYKTEQPAKKQSAAKYKSALKKLGIELKEIDFDKKIFTFHAKYKSIELSGTHLMINLDENGNVCLLKGVWPKQIRPGGSEKVSFCDEIVDLSDSFENGGEIQAIEPVYSLFDSNSRKYYYKPLWKVTVDNETKILK